MTIKVYFRTPSLERHKNEYILMRFSLDVIKKGTPSPLCSETIQNNGVFCNHFLSRTQLVTMDAPADANEKAS